MDKIHAKWGFGNAPLKEAHRAKTKAAIRTVLALLESVPDAVLIEQLESISHLKGQFTRMVKQDQWDWSTVWMLFGRPGRTPATFISRALGHFRSALKNGDRAAAERAAAELRSTDFGRYCDSFLSGGREPAKQDGSNGFLYILSTRDQPRLLKIGITQRAVDVRVKEINSATGVAVPFGIRAVWRVDDASAVERQVHRLLASYRLRADREFFEIEFSEASRLINDHLGVERLSSGASAGVNSVCGLTIGCRGCGALHASE